MGGGETFVLIGNWFHWINTNVKKNLKTLFGKDEWKPGICVGFFYYKFKLICGSTFTAGKYIKVCDCSILLQSDCKATVPSKETGWQKKD